MEIKNQMYCAGGRRGLSGRFEFGQEQQKFVIVEDKKGGRNEEVFDVKAAALDFGAALFKWLYGNIVERKFWRAFYSKDSSENESSLFMMSTVAYPSVHRDLFNEFDGMLREEKPDLRELRRYFRRLSPNGLLGLGFRIEDISLSGEEDNSDQDSKVMFRFTTGRLNVLNALYSLKSCLEDDLYLIGSIRIRKEGDKISISAGNAKFMPLEPEHINVLSYGISRTLEGKPANISASKLNYLSYGNDVWQRGGVRIQLAGRAGILSTLEDLCRFGVLAL